MGFWAFSKFGLRSNHHLGYNWHPKSKVQKKVEEKKKNKKRKRDETPGVTNFNALIVENREIRVLDNKKASSRGTIKIIMKRKVGKRRGIISDLPISILHRILSFLSPRDQAITSLLSKQWNFTRKSFPRLIFHEPDGEVISEERRGNCLDYVDRSLQYFVQHKLCIESISLDLRLEASEFFPVVDTWLPLALHCGAFEISFFVRSFGYALPDSTFVVNSSIQFGCSEFFSLQKLTLVNIILSDDIVCNINRNCPYLTDLTLDSVRGLKNLIISKPKKLLTLSIFGGKELKNIFVDAPSLDHFLFDGVTCERRVIDLTSCYNMRKLELVNVFINDDLFHLHISRFPLLEVLHITEGHLLRRIQISLQRLKHLRLYYCKAIEAIAIDAPTLSKFDLITCQRLPEVPVYDPNEVSFNIEELRGAIIPPSVEVECLDFCDFRIKHSAYWPTILQGLIWSCHPKRVKMCNKAGNCIKDFCQMVKQTKCLKAAKIESIGGIEPKIKSTGGIERKQFQHLLDNFFSIPQRSFIFFKLEWDHSAIQGLNPS